jgi:dihydroorotate dehydrogenase (fumarate)/dihydroorotate dehydrogenase
MSLYRRLARPLLFRGDAETLHDRAIRTAELTARSALACRIVAALEAPPSDPRLATGIGGLRFAHPIGLAAGFDKNGRATPFWAALGFSHVEIGSVSAEPSMGNPKPRLFRIPEDKAIVVHYGLPNEGCDRVAARLETVHLNVPLGINIVNTNRGPEAEPASDEEVIGDYVRSIRRLEPCADYLVLNMSCPNTRDGRAFCSGSVRLASLLGAVADLRPARPVFLKVAPFAGAAEIETFLEVVERFQFVTGFAVNLPPGKPTALKCPPELLARMPGAVSGRPSEAIVNQTISEIYSRMDRLRYQIIGAGGVFSAEDAYRKLLCGASMVQLLTGMVYEGPGIVRGICAGLGALLERDGFKNVSEAVGTAVPGTL